MKTFKRVGLHKSVHISQPLQNIIVHYFIIDVNRKDKEAISSHKIKFNVLCKKSGVLIRDRGFAYFQTIRNRSFLPTQLCLVVVLRSASLGPLSPTMSHLYYYPCTDLQAATLHRHVLKSKAKN